MNYWQGDTITSMTGNNIFVYGANPEFRNGAGAAKAAIAFGAKPYGSGRGIVGNTYGLVTKNLTAGFVETLANGDTIKYGAQGARSLDYYDIELNIEELYECARANPDKKFFITYKMHDVNLNGYTGAEMRAMFVDNKQVPDNVLLHNSMRLA